MKGYHPENCPECDIGWYSDNEIPEDLMKFNPGHYNTIQKARAAAESYGWSDDKPLRFGKNMVGIEIQGGYDGVSYWRCDKCKAVFDRFTMKLVEEQ